jgi:hypothetical protein
MVAALSFLGAAALARGGTGAAAGLACLVLAEAAIFAGPFQPRVPLAEDPPASPVTAWLQSHTGDHAVAGQGFDLIPNLATVYGLRDVRGVDVTVDARPRTFWSHADPGFSDQSAYTQLDRPAAAWLAAAGVRYYISAPSAVPDGSMAVLQGPGFTVSEVPGARPFAFAAASVTPAGGADDAAAKLALSPLGAITVETPDLSPPDGQATVLITRQDAGAVDLDVTATTAATVVVLQSFTPDWVARVDGTPAPVRPADVLFQSVSVAAGHHVVSLRYQPASVTYGLGTSLLGVLGLVALFGVPMGVRRRRARRGSAGSASR